MATAAHPPQTRIDHNLDAPCHAGAWQPPEIARLIRRIDDALRKRSAPVG